MSDIDDELEIIRGSGNIFRDFNRPNADLEHFRAVLAAEILGILEDRALSVRKAAEMTGIDAGDFSRIRRANIGRFTIDRLMTILARLDQEIDIKISVRPRQTHPQSKTAHR